MVRIGPHTLYCADAYRLRPQLGFFDAEVMDPPYVIRTAGGGSFRKHRPYLDQIQQEGLDRGFDHKIINPLLCGSVVVFCHNDQLPGVSAYLNGLFHRFALCVWRKLTPMPVANKHYVPELELYFHAWNRGYHPEGSLADLKRVVECRSRALKDYAHPAVKPDEVMNKILRNVSGRTVIDPFMGTGSTGVAAIRAGKIFTGIEHNPKHFQTAIARISAAWEQANR
ncbi:site-specific DNA-methyltransferase [Novosphingobium sp. 9]|uniref:site-specific DNA-methyltransferase n=1 Tax=Novosphingobium sp. 9 TaxID=2025349 RepID=UPI0021B531C1|nr:site-specific DNA-methyltransferase [Novosphingobium sp. 9]